MSPLRALMNSMEVGDSILWTGDPNELRQRMNTMKRFDGKKFVSESEYGGVRAWRVE